MMVLEEDWGISPERIRQFFRMQPDITETPAGFQYGNCQISLISIQTQLLGKWPQTRTVVRMEGPETDVHLIHQRFFLQFLSAGG